MISSLLVHSRTELTFLPDPASATSVQSNLPLPKLNEVYYWEVKMFDLPESTNVAVGLATKPYPHFRLPGHSRYSVAYHSNGDKTYNYPFTATPLAPSLKEGDIVGVGYRPRSGTVFFTRNGRKLEDAFVGFNSYNLFPTIGADGPCSIHVNLGQVGFVFIEANVKKWGLAPSVGTLAPPPAYGSERGSILLETGAGVSPRSVESSRSTNSRRLHRTRRPRPISSVAPAASSPLRAGIPTSPPPPPTPPPPITPIDEEPETINTEDSHGYISPTDLPFHTPPNTHIPASPPSFAGSVSDDGHHSSPPSRPHSPDRSAGANPFISKPHRQNPSNHDRRPDSELASVRAGQELPLPDSPNTPGNPPTPNHRDISLQALSGGASSSSGTQGSLRNTSSATMSRRDPPAYSPLDAYAYRDGVHLDLPAEVIAAALERGTIPPTVIPASRSTSERRSRRRREAAP